MHQNSFLPKIQSIDTTFDVTYYGLNLGITLQPDSLHGMVTMQAKIKAIVLDSLVLDASDVLKVDSVICDGTKAVFKHFSDKLFIKLPRQYLPGEMIKTTSYYHGEPIGTGYGSFSFGSHNGNPSIYTLSEPYGSKDWWICKDTPADKADSADIIITAPEALTAVSNGKLVSVTNSGNGYKTTHWHVSYPIAQYLISIAVSNYSKYTHYFKYSSTDSMEVSHFLYPENMISAMPEITKTTGMLKVFTELFGPYPFLTEKYGHAQFGWGGGMEHQTVSSMGRFTESLISHELAHQWFGDMVTNSDWAHIWLHEGFATYGEALYIEKTQGKAAYNEFIAAKMTSAKSASGSIYVKDVTEIGNIFDYARSYAKGCVVLHSLRGVLGDSLFFQSLRHYLNAPGNTYGTATTKEFVNSVNFISHKNMQYFFDEWIYGNGFPTYEVYWEKWSSESLNKITVSIIQGSALGNQLFSMPINIRVFGNSADTIFPVFNNAINQTFTFTCGFEPKGIEIDPENLIMKSVTVFNADSLANIPSGFVLFQNYPNPFNNGTTISFYLAKPQTLKIEIFDISGGLIKVITSGMYSRGLHIVPLSLYADASGTYIYRITTENGTVSKKNDSFAMTVPFEIVRPPVGS